jgi:hypothetical protein
MSMKKISTACLNTLILCTFSLTLNAQEGPVIKKFKPFVWKSDKPEDCPFKDSEVIVGLKFLGIKSGFYYGDTWYPSWASDDKLYSPWTDGNTKGVESISSGFTWNGQIDEQGVLVRKATTGQAVISGDDPLVISVDVLGLSQADPYPYGGRYPCGSLVYNGVWYYGTYCLSPYAVTKYGDTTYNWPFLGPFVGFRYSTDYGKTWVETLHIPSSPIFGEDGIGGHPVKIGSPHFVDFGRNMEYSPDGKAYLVAHGADQSGCGHAIYHNSWITGDQIYLLRVTPGIENMNDPSRYEFFSGNDKNGNPVWTNDFKKIKPLLEWNDKMGCVTVTYNAPLKKYLMCVTDGGNTCARMHTYILESDKLTGEWKLVTYMKNFGEQGYFVNFPSKFISNDGKTAWLLYSGNFAPDWNNEKINENPPGSHYGMVLQKVEFLFK